MLFQAKQGVPAKFISYNGKTFKAAARYLKTVFKDGEVKKYATMAWELSGYSTLSVPHCGRCIQENGQISLNKLIRRVKFSTNERYLVGYGSLVKLKQWWRGEMTRSEVLPPLQRFAGRLSEENRQGIPCGFVSTLHITTSGLSPALWFIQCTCTLQNHKVHPVCFLLTTYLQSAVHH